MLEDVTVGAGASTLDIALQRNWASSTGGASIASDNDSTGTVAGCGPAAIINDTRAIGWSPFNPASGDRPAPSAENHLDANAPTAVIALPRPVNVTVFGADPSATCGDDDSATTREFTIETSTDGTTFTMAYDGRGTEGFDAGDFGDLRTLAPAGGSTAGVRFVRLTLLSPQDTCGDCSGKDFIDFTELQVFGNAVPTAGLSVPSTAVAGQAVTLDATSSTDDGTLSSYAWDFDGDGSADATTSAPTVSHVYPAAGSFTPRVTVTDAGAATASASSSIAVSAAPVVAPVRPRVTLPKQTANRASIRITCAVPCAVTASIRVSRAMAKRLKRKNRTVGSVRRNLKAGTHTVRVPVARPALRSLRARRIRRVRLGLTARVKDFNGLVTTVSRSPRVPISRR